MFISSKEVEAIIGRELSVRLCEWIRACSPVTCREEGGVNDAIRFDIDEAIEFAKIRMHQERFKREFFPHLVKLKHAKVCGAFESARSA